MLLIHRFRCDINEPSPGRYRRLKLAWRGDGSTGPVRPTGTNELYFFLPIDSLREINLISLYLTWKDKGN